MKNFTICLLLVLSSVSFGCADELREAAEQASDEKIMIEASAGDISNWDPALKPPFPMGPLLFQAAAAAPTLQRGPWLYRKVYNPAHPDPATNYAFYDGVAGQVNFFENYAGLYYFWAALLQIAGTPMETLKAMLAEASTQTVVSSAGPTPGYQVEYGGMDPVTGKKFILQSSGATIQQNPSVNTAVLIDLANRWCM